MRIEEVDKGKLSKAYDKELLILKLRFTQLWDKNFEGNDTAVVGSLNRNHFLKNFKLLLNEMSDRKIEKSTSAIDKAVFKKAMTANKFGIDVSDFDDIIVASDCVFVDAFSATPDTAVAVTKAKQVEVAELFEQPDEPEGAYIPLYDLVLKAKQETVIIEVSKPYPNEHSARLQSPDKFDPKSFRRTSGGTLYGSKKITSTVSIIWGKLKGKAKPSDPPIAQALRFPTKNWTAAKAKKWLGDNEMKYMSFESAKKASKKLLSKTSKDKVSTEANDASDYAEEDKKFEKFISVYPIDKADIADEHLVCGIVYEPDVEDAQGDKANEVEIRKAAYQFMEEVQTFRVMHKGKKVKVKVLESYIAPVDFTVAKQAIKKGTWVLTVRILDKKIWKAVKDGELSSFSMAGYAKTA
ncbi:hypothetical protein LCGC14_1558010 [marine sediment metagenome]|uniref:Phage-like element PBSX protein XkdF domain-containing protein n=1 Tax=marine sediment metagenome TaxID=412755 RepID=A0A0F9IND7_9ZZZZ